MDPQKYTDPLFKESVEFVKTLVDKGYLEKEGFSRPYFMDGIDKFAAGNGAMFVGLLSDVGNWKVFSDKLGVEQRRLLPHDQLPRLQVQGPAGGPGRGNRLRRHDMVEEPEAGRRLRQVRHHRRGREVPTPPLPARSRPTRRWAASMRPILRSRPSSSTSRAAWPTTTSRLFYNGYEDDRTGSATSCSSPASSPWTSSSPSTRSSSRKAASITERTGTRAPSLPLLATGVSAMRHRSLERETASPPTCSSRRCWCSLPRSSSIPSS